MLTVLAGMSTAFFYALHDLVAQRVSRTAGLVLVLAWIIPTGAVILLPVAFLTGAWPASGGHWGAVACSAAAGVLYLGTWFTMLRALQVGELSVVAPLASLEGLIVALIAVGMGDGTSALLGVGIALAIVGGTLAAVQGRARSAAGSGWALLTSAQWALVMLLFDQAGELSWLAQAAWSRVATLVLFVPVALVVLRRLRGADPSTAAWASRALGRRGIALCVLAGLFELAGLVGTALAVKVGPLAVAGVTIAQYATVAAILGLVFLKERPRRHQLAGVACTLVAVTLLSAGA